MAPITRPTEKTDRRLQLIKLLRVAVVWQL